MYDKKNYKRDVTCSWPSLCHTFSDPLPLERDVLYGRPQTHDTRTKNGLWPIPKAQDQNRRIKTNTTFKTSVSRLEHWLSTGQLKKRIKWWTVSMQTLSGSCSVLMLLEHNYYYDEVVFNSSQALDEQTVVSRSYATIETMTWLVIWVASHYAHSALVRLLPVVSELTSCTSPMANIDLLRKTADAIASLAGSATALTARWTLWSFESWPRMTLTTVFSCFDPSSCFALLRMDAHSWRHSRPHSVGS